MLQGASAHDRQLSIRHFDAELHLISLSKGPYRYACIVQRLFSPSPMTGGYYLDTDDQITGAVFTVQDVHVFIEDNWDGGIKAANAGPCEWN
eukprot:6199743-Pleurochrysis_carterae.AAC.6